ncbi:MAG: hypothetical protein J7501_08095 [Bdellovibrio sp.]|nr:hypothetical protein [Bdellovibrio sp.]
MTKFVLPLALMLAGSVSAFATPLTSENIIGRYKVDAHYGPKHAYLKFNVVNSNEFEVTRYNPDTGERDATCQGTFKMTNSSYYNDLGILTDGGRYFKGVFTCPNDRSKKIDFNIDYKGTQLEDLDKGANVTVTTSLAPVRLKAFVIRDR